VEAVDELKGEDKGNGNDEAGNQPSVHAGKEGEHAKALDISGRALSQSIAKKSALT
jgi:hypothetical protein